MPDREARRVTMQTLDALVGGLAEADRRYPTTPPDMRAAVEAQLTRLAGSAW